METIEGKVIVITAPSGAGKTSIIRPFLKNNTDFVYSVSATTRARRDGETDGMDYFFITESEFLKKLSNNEFLEWERVYDYYYGTLKSFVEDTISSGKHIVIEVEVKGALSVKRKYPEAILVFIEPPSFEDLALRLKNRRTENEEDFVKRMERAKWELNEKDKFDKTVMNKDLQTAIDELTNYILSKVKGK